ncbi:MAG: YcxB family protein [Alphaproteobacteria bacterium]
MHPFDEPQLNVMPEAQNTNGKTVVPLAFRLEKQDLHTFYQMAIKRGAGAGPFQQLCVSKWGMLGVAVAVVLSVIAVLAFTSSSLLANVWFLFSLVLFVCLICLMVQLSIVSKALLPSENGLVLGRRTYEIEEDGLVVSQDGTQQAFMWSSINEVVEDDNSVYLFVDKNMAHIFPKAVFASNIQAQEFAAFAREKVNLSRI